MRRSRMALALGPLLLVLPLLGGCSEDPVPKVAPHQSPSASESPTGSGTGQRDSWEPRFIEDYFATVGESTTSGDTATFLSLSSPKCQNCQTLAHNIEAAYANGGHVEGGDWTVVRLRRTPEASPLGSIWNVDVKTTRERWFDGSDKLVKIVRPSTQYFGVIVNKNSSGLVLRDLRIRS